MKTLFPKHINTYTFINNFPVARSERPYVFGLYRDKTGASAFAKMYYGGNKSMARISLEHEITIYSLLNSYSKKTNQSLRIKIPSYLGTFRDAQRTILLIEFINATTIEHSPLETRIRAITSALTYIHDLNKWIKKEDISKFHKRTPAEIYAYFPVVAARSLMKNPQLATNIAKASALFFRSFPDVLATYHPTFVHKSIELRNILEDHGSFVLIDFELAGLSHPAIELVQLFQYAWFDRQLSASFYNKPIIHKILSEKRMFGAFKALSLYNIMIELPKKKDPIEQAADRNYLSFILRQSESYEKIN